MMNCTIDCFSVKVNVLYFEMIIFLSLMSAEKRRKEEDLKLTRAEEFLGLSALHGPLLLKLQHRCSEDPLDLL